ncbi:MAG: ATP-binding protein [Bacteroidetes bacterium]|jgi:signal transduction histidine kinase|nr:ATP-binding protein [Bacteroidota bacterium]
MAILKRILQAGIHPGLDTETRQNVSMLNVFALVMVGYMLVAMASTAPVFGLSISLLLLFSWALLSACCIYLNHRRYYQLARNLFSESYLFNVALASVAVSSVNYMDIRIVCVAFMVISSVTFPHSSRWIYVHQAVMLVNAVFLQEIVAGLHFLFGYGFLYPLTPAFIPYMVLAMVALGMIVVLNKRRTQYAHSMAETTRALAAVQQQSQEMEVQQEELRQNNEELFATQEQMRQTQQVLLVQARELEEKGMLIARQHRLEQSAARVAELSRWGAGMDLQAWGAPILDYLATAVGATHASLYVAEAEAPNHLLRQVAGHAIPVNGAAEIHEGEGLLGQCLKDRQDRYLVLDDKLDTYVATSLVSVVPRHYYIQPLVYQGQVYGALELVALEAISEEHMNLLSTACAAIAANLQSAVANQRIRLLLNETQQKNQQLQQHEEELRQNYEELKAAQEEMTRAQLELERLNENLEQRVAERTAALEHAMDEVKATQNQLVLREKMVTLGVLVAGVAHEINTPIGAVRASADNLLDNLPTVVSGFPALLQRMPQRLTGELTALLDKLLAPSADKAPLTSREQRQLRKALAQHLEERGVPEPETYAQTLVESGYRHDTLEEITLLTSEYSREVSQLIYAVCQIRANVENISIASDKTKKIVYALKNYSRAERSEYYVAVDLAQNIDTILTLYQGQMKQGVEVEFDVLARPIVLANPDALGQIWTNLISNSLQAMKYHGQMRIVLDQQAGQAIVRIVDNGPGVPEELQQKIFEPFFTTKGAGEGTGLGLDICKKILETYGGYIELESRPGQTEFRVLLPLAGGEA